MHMRGEPGTMQDEPRYRSVVEDVRIVGGTVVLTVSNYATRSLIGEKHSCLAPAE